MTEAVQNTSISTEVLPLILDDVVPQSFAVDVERTLFSNNFSWYYLPDVTYGHNAENNRLIKQLTHGFYHLFFNNNQPQSAFYGYISVIPHLAAQKFPELLNCTLQEARSFLYIPTGNEKRKTEHNNPHVDGPYPHYVCLYYVNDSEGDTTFFGLSPNDPVSFKVTPKRGRIVVFDGATYHASTSPKQGKRAIINFVLQKRVKHEDTY